MAIPGFHAEVSLHQRFDPYAQGPRVGDRGHRIVPAWTEEERQHLIYCDQRYKTCEDGCAPIMDYSYDQWRSCHDDCNQELDNCLGP